MAKFVKKNKKGISAINTASMSDIVFMLLFFFMVTTSMKEANLRVKIVAPLASEAKKLEKKSLVSYIYIGSPLKQYQGVYGTEPRIQLNDAYKELNDIRDFITVEREARNESDRSYMTVSLKVDKDAKMGIITDLKQELRKANALKISYSSKKEVKQDVKL